MEGIPYTGFIKNENSVKRLAGLLRKKTQINKHSACYVSRLRGGAEPSYNVSYSLDKDKGIDITLTKPNKIVIGMAVLNKQVICFTPLDSFKINSIKLLEI